VDAVGAADAEGVAVLQRPLDQRVAVGAGAAEDAFARAASAASRGTKPSSAQASVAASSTSSQLSIFACDVQTAPISGRV
jgi:hypothetical protein